MPSYALRFYVLLVSWMPTADQSAHAIEACSNVIYCNDDVLRSFQLQGVFDDGKTFVDLPMRFDPDFVLEMFKRLYPPTVNGSKAFIDLFFLQNRSDVINWVPNDWTPSPPLLDKIKDPVLKSWAVELNKIWFELGRKIDPDVYEHPQRHSIIPVPHPFIVPGGRFKEFYYWDTYWIVKGLLICNMTETVANIILNFIDLVNRYGFVPNGGRVYYTERSQPPVLSLMVWDYYLSTGNQSFVSSVFDVLEKEHDHWLSNKTVEVKRMGKTYKLAHYRAGSTVPRPESYKEDVDTAKGLSPELAAALYQEIASAAESGWDFSSRWMAQSKDNASTMQTMRTTKVVPVDLNAILCDVERKLAKMAILIGNSTKNKTYSQLSDQRAEAMDFVLWNSTLGLWLDYDMELEQHTQAFYQSAFIPIATGATNNRSRIRQSIQNLQLLNVLSYDGGVPTSLNQTHQQWDYPNAWPPLQWFTVVALQEANYSDLAFDLAQKWVATNYKAWTQTKHMYEKYDATKAGVPGGGGEYNVQTGFGWTNGVIFYLLHQYGDQLNHNDFSADSSTPIWSVIVLVLVCLIAVIASVGICCRIYQKGKHKYQKRNDDNELLWRN